MKENNEDGYPTVSPMKMNTLLGFLFLVYGFASPALAQETAQFDAALEQAQAENKGVALFLYASSYGTSAAPEEVIPDDWSIQTYLERNYVLISVDAESEEGKVLAQKYSSLDWYPTLSLMDKDGKREVFYMIRGEELDARDWARRFLEHELMMGRLSAVDE